MALRFAKDDKTRLASASQDGSISVFNLTSEPPSLECTLRGHSRAVNGELRGVVQGWSKGWSKGWSSQPLKLGPSIL